MDLNFKYRLNTKRALMKNRRSFTWRYFLRRRLLPLYVDGISYFDVYCHCML